VVPLYLLTAGLFDKKAAFWAGLAFVVAPVFNELAVQVMRDPIFIFFVGWAVYFFWRAITDLQNFHFLMASGSSICAMLCRIEGVILFAVFLPMLLVLAVKDASARRQLLRGAALLAGLPLTLGMVLGGTLMLATGVEPAAFSRLGEPVEKLRAILNGDFLAGYHRLYEEIKSFSNPAGQWRNGSFSQVARHYLWLLYLISVVERVAKNLFLLFVLPLFFGFGKRPRPDRGQWLILLVASTYFLTAYYFLFERDFIDKRYVLVPTLFLFPWVGYGLVRMQTLAGECRRPKMAMAMVLMAFCLIPAGKSLEGLKEMGKRNGLKMAGQWLRTQPDLQGKVIACSDPRVRFYASAEMKFLKKMEKYPVARDFKKMESMAYEGKAALLIVDVSRNKRNRITEFRHYSVLKEFETRNNPVVIFKRNGSYLIKPDSECGNRLAGEQARKGQTGAFRF
jgi:4-amino-4-deoxy-L-arabinose transferase-like glycosyltransferase